jgi:hypothetical protein
MPEILIALGRGLIKVLIGLFVGFGVGLVVVGYFSMQSRSAWDFNREPPIGELCLGIGAGLLTSAFTMAVLFFSTWTRKTSGDASKSH